jgi:hypothetical protein
MVLLLLSFVGLTTQLTDSPRSGFFFFFSSESKSYMESSS